VKLTPPEPPLDDGVVRLTPLGPPHVPAMRALGDDPDVARFTYVTSPWTDEKAQAWVDRYVAGWGDGKLAGFAIEESGGGTFLGFLALVRYDAAGREAEIGYIVAPAARGRGVAGRALALATDWCLGPLRLQRLELRIDVANGASLRVAERLGFARDGVLRSVHFKEGRRVDLAVYSRLPTDL
jgi:RimJ/RimL family protein N-acetyltransferase